MKTIILLTLIAGAFAQYTLEQQFILQQQQPLLLQQQQPLLLQQQQPLLLQKQQQLLQPGLAGLGSPLNVPLQQQFIYQGGLQENLALPNQFYNPYLFNNNPYLLKNPYLPVNFPAVETLKEIDILEPVGIAGTVELNPLDAVIMENKNKGVGHHEIYSYARNGLPNTGRSSMEFGGYPQQTRFMKPESQRYAMRASPLRAVRN